MGSSVELVNGVNGGFLAERASGCDSAQSAQ